MVDIGELTKLTDDDREAVRDAKGQIDEKTARLRDVVPVILDLSCREPTLPAPYGHTLDDKKEVLRLAKEFGFTDLAVGSFFDFPNVDEQFCRYLNDQGDTMDGYFGNVMVVRAHKDKPFKPSYSMDRIAEFGIPNILLLTEIRPKTVQQNGASYDDYFADLIKSIEYMRAQVLPEASERRGRIYMRFLDIFDAWDEDPDFVAKVMKLLSNMPIQAIIFEDVRGTHFPFQTAELVKLIRRYHPPPVPILVHPHSGNGLEDASVIEAVLAGADGVWAGFTPEAAMGAHGSTAMLFSNLLRAGNPHVKKNYDVKRLTEIADRMSRIHMGEPIHQYHPVIGSKAYHYIDDQFEQVDLPCDLAPEIIGQEVGYRVTPAWSNPVVVGRRLEQLGYPAELTQDPNFIRECRIVMCDWNIAGRRFLADDPDELANVVAEAKDRIARHSEAAE